MFAFTHSERKFLWQGGILVGFGEILQTNRTLLSLPVKIPANLPSSAPQASIFNPHSANCHNRTDFATEHFPGHVF